MLRVLALLWLIAGLLLGVPVSPAHAADVDPSVIFQDIENAAARLHNRDISVGAALDRDIAILTAALNARGLQPDVEIVFHYYRALARYWRNEFNHATGQGYNGELLRQTLAELEEAVTAIDKLPGRTPGWDSIKANALYFTGSAIHNQQGDKIAPYRYWASCAALDHAGCMNIMALALTTGEGRVGIDLTEAIRMHKRTFDSTTRYGCAGVSSAYNIAVLVALRHVKNTKDNPEIWIENAGNLLNAVEADEPGSDRCGRSDIELAQYLILLSHGKKRDALLNAVMTRYPSKPAADIARYLRGEIGDAALRAKAASYGPADRCDAYFYALWASDIAKNRASVKQYQALLAESDSLNCRIHMAYTRPLQ